MGGCAVTDRAVLRSSEYGRWFVAASSGRWWWVPGRPQLGRASHAQVRERDKLHHRRGDHAHQPLHFYASHLIDVIARVSRARARSLRGRSSE